MKTRLVSYLGTRVTKETRSAFIKKARTADGMDQSDILRELIHAYVENRLSVQPATPKEILK